MGELRRRPPAEVTAPDRAPHQDSRGRPQQSDSPDLRGRPEAGRSADGTGEDRDQVYGYDADAQFKKPVSKPAGYLPDDTGGHASASVALRERDGPADGPDLTRQNDMVAAPYPREVADGDRGDASRAIIDRPDFRDPSDDRPPDRYGDPLTRPDGTRVPCLDGPPRREQTRQGWAGDCGIIAALGAVAAHRPEEITRRIQPLEDGSYQVTLSEARQAEGGIAEPTGRDIELTIKPELPVYEDDPAAPACAKTRDGAAWCAIFEKAFGGVDQTWTEQRQGSWADDWTYLCAEDRADNVENPRSGPAPSGYIRLHQGTTPWERAEALTQLTGRPATVREFPDGQEEWRINRIIRDQLTDGKPVLVSSRPEAYSGELLPHGLKAGHVYEVTGVEQGKILLRNPWNKDHPQPMETDEFARAMNRYYSTLV
jgi:hypothetical protein